ncbi:MULTISPECIES: hypothetical protein [unclassified Shewanella]|uniref:hypothetical protein n=1 Tax=unclassified Shewanella TaxID=196818 RepID=UPI0021DA7B66|nr:MULTISPECIES: hypothetical protein [unclassified Shewanella]MCU8013240.1 hypothetical protein [Shewanella sp. SM74]MCU8072693.1 hypothetical protein [Shewanella sp. SM29]
MKHKTQDAAKVKIMSLHSDASSQGTSTLGLIYRVFGILLLLSVITFGINAWA